MRMRLLPALLLLVSSCGAAAQAQVAVPPLQVLFASDRTCGDNPTDCPFAGVTAQHRYLHVVLHDTPGNAVWGVWVGPTCESAATAITGGYPVTASGFREIVVDLQSTSAPAPQTTPLCYLFRGAYGQAMTYYSAYFDDSRSPDAERLYPNYERMGGRPDLADLDVTYIHRSPSFAYDASPNMPREGQAVRYVVHLLNVGGRPISSFRYTWLLDGKVVDGGVVAAPLPAFAETTLSVASTWTAAPHVLTFRATPTDAELSDRNNALSVATDAVTLGFWVERSAYDYFRAYQLRYCAVQGCTGSDSFEDWLQRQVGAWNELFRRARYSGVSPGGITTRVRVDEIVVTPDSALPLAGGIPSDSPDRADHSVDLQWGLVSQGVAGAYALIASGPFRIDWSLLHELGHARSLADLYRFNLRVDAFSRLDVTGLDGLPAYDPGATYGVAGKIRPFTATDGGPVLYQNIERDLMSCVCSDFYGPYTARVLNRLGNRRAVCGNYNPPCNIGDWYLDLPKSSYLRVLNAAGAAVRGPVSARVFFDTGTEYAVHRFATANSAVLAQSALGFRLPADPFRARGSADRAGHNLLLIEVATPSLDQFCFQEPSEFNVAFWQGHTDTAHPAVFTLRLGHTLQNGCNLTPPPALVNEPFAVSAASSTVHVGAVERVGQRAVRRVQVELRDTARTPLRGRRLVLTGPDGHVLAGGVTGVDGRLTVWVPAAASTVVVDDTTDNHFTLRSP